MVRLFSLLCFILFGVYDSIQSEKSGGSRCLKPFLMPALIVFYLSSASSVQWLLAAALAFDWAGDVFLMSRRHRALLAGVISFGIGHVLRILLFVQQGLVFDDVVVLAMFMMAAYGWSVLNRIRFPLPVIRNVCLGYGGVLCLMSVAACMAMRGGGSVLSWIGSLLFVYSDSLIGLKEWGGDSGRGIMETYLIGQFLIVLGVLL